MAKISEVLEMKDKMSSVLDKIYNKMDRLEGETEKTRKSVGLLAKIQIGQLIAKGLGMAKDLISDCVTSINEQIEAEQRLQTIMSSGGASQAEIDSVRKRAQEYEKITTYQDDALKAGMSELATYKLSGKALEGMMGTLADYAAGQGGINVDQRAMVEYANQLGKALDGNYGGLTKIGFVFTDAQKKIIDTGNEMERVKVITDVIEDSYGGLAEAIAKTPSGKIAQMRNKLDGLRDSIGLKLLPYIQMLMDKISKIADSPAFAAFVDKLASGLGFILKILGWLIDKAIIVYNYIANNWSWIGPAIYGIVGAIVAWQIAQGILNLVMSANPVFIFAAILFVLINAFPQLRNVILAAAIAFGIFNLVLNANPIFLIITLIVLIITKIIEWVNAVGGLKIAWLIVVNALLTAWDWVKIGFFTGVYWVLDLWDKMRLGMMTAGVAIANFMGDMKASVLMILQNMVNGAIDIINGFINILNKIPGVNIGLIERVTFGTNAKLANEAEKQAREKNLANAKAEIEARIAGRAEALDTMKADAVAATQSRLAEIDAAQAAAREAKNKEKALNQPSADNYIYKGGAGLAAGDSIDVGEVDKPVEIKSEDLKILRELAEKETIVNLTSLAPQITVKVDNTNGQVDTKKIIKAVDSYLTGEIKKVPAGSYGLG